MKTIDASWDTRSLGFKSAELTIEPMDDLGMVLSGLQWADDYEYVVVKVSPLNPAAIQIVQGHNYVFTETSIKVSRRLNPLKLPAIVERFADSMTCVLLNDETRSSVFSKIKEGMFETDRVARDPRFGVSVAAKRYINWIEDEMCRGSSLYEVLYKDNEVGFFTLKGDGKNRVATSFLGGAYKKYSGLGFASYILAVELREFLALGYALTTTNLSSNNLPIIRTHQSLGFQFDKMDYVFCRS